MAKRGQATLELYDLAADVGEACNVARQHLDVVCRLQALLAACREDLGDGLTGAPGRNCRPAGQVASPVPLAAEYPAGYPLIAAEYDLADAG